MNFFYTKSRYKRLLFTAALFLLFGGAGLGVYLFTKGPSRAIARKTFSLKTINLGQTDTAFPIKIMAAEGAVVSRSDDGFSIMPEISVRDTAAGFSVRVTKNEFFDLSLAEVLRAEKAQVTAQPNFERFLRESDQGFVYVQNWGGAAVFDFLYIAKQGDQFFYFKVDDMRSYTQQQVEAMYECVSGL